MARDDKTEFQSMKAPGDLVFKSGFLLGKDGKRKSKKAENKEVSIQSSGYKRGFLLPSKNNEDRNINSKEKLLRQSKRTAQTSRDLLEIDDQSILLKNPLLVVEQDQDSEGLHDRKKAALNSQSISILSEEVSSQTPRKLIEELSPVFSNENRSTCYENLKEPLVHEVISKLKGHKSKEHEQGAGAEQVGERKGGESQYEAENDRSDSKIDEISWLRFQQELESFLWDNQMVKFQDNRDWTFQQVTWAWRRLAECKSNFQFHHQSLVLLLLQHPKSLVSFFQPQSQTERMTALSLVHYLKSFLRNPAAMKIEWPVEILIALTSLCSQKRRTILAQESWISALLILALSSEICLSQVTVGADHFETEQIATMMECLENLIDTKLSWHQWKKNSSKRQLEIAILKDWKQVNRIYRENVDISWCMQVCDRIGGLQATLCFESVSSEAALVEALLSHSMSGASHDRNEFDKRSLLRGLLASMTISKLSSACIQEVVSMSLKILQNCNSSDTVNLIISVLDILWFGPRVSPHDTLSISSMSSEELTVPPSFYSLLDILHSFSRTQADAIILDPISHAIGALVARCLIGRRDGKDMAQAIIKRHGITNSTLHVLATTVSNGTIDTHFSSSKDEVILYSIDILVSNIQSSKFLRKRLISSNGEILAGENIPLRFTFFRLMKVVANSYGSNGGGDTAEVRSSIGIVMTAILVSRQTSFDHLINDIVSVLNKVSSENIKDVDKKKIVGRICSVFGPRWRRTLLGGDGLFSESFGNLIISIAQAMFQSPASLPPLCLLGAVVGEDLTDEFRSKALFRDRIFLAIESLVSRCCKELRERRLKIGQEAIFGRLCPLLVLRRIPVIYFQIAREESRKITKVLRFSALLANEMIIRLALGNTAELECEYNEAFSWEERRLAAEIAGRCLCFTELKKICTPVFESFFADDTDSNNLYSSLEQIRRAKMALFAMCNHLSASTDELYYDNNDDVDLYMITGRFALKIINLDTINSIQAEELMELQTGCIEFFAIAFMLHLSMDITPVTDSTKGNILVEDITQKGDQLSLFKPRQKCRSTSIFKLYSAVISIIENAKNNYPWVELDSGELVYSVAARICLWNAVIVVSKRYGDNDETLKIFCRSILPWIILNWGTTEPDDSIRHPLCITAALQVTYILVTRSKTLSCFTKQAGTSQNNVTQAHQWALRILKTRHTKLPHGFKEMRLAALKLLIAIVTADNLDSDGIVFSRSLGPRELGETINLLMGLSNMDIDFDVRSLASHVLGLLQKVY